MQNPKSTDLIDIVVKSTLIISSVVVAVAVLTSQHRCMYWHGFWQLELNYNCNTSNSSKQYQIDLLQNMATIA